MAITRLECQRLAALCKTKAEFLEKHRAAYMSCHRFGWQDILATLPSRESGPYKWSDEKISEVVSKYENFSDFVKENSSLYTILWQTGRVDRFASDLVRGRNPNGYWTKDRCHEAALRCSSRAMFCRLFSGAVDAAHRMGWMDEICGHMRLTEKYRCKSVYIIKAVGEREVYIGIAANPNRRYVSHLAKPMPHTRQILAKPHRLRVIAAALPVEKAVLAEKKLIAHFRKKGWAVVNITHGGQVGSYPRKWTKKTLSDVIATVETRGELHDKHLGAYSAAHENGWLDELFAGHRNRGYGDGPIRDWSIERLRDISRECRSRADMKTKYPKAFQAAHRRKCLDEIFSEHPDAGFTRSDKVRIAKGKPKWPQ